MRRGFVLASVVLFVVVSARAEMFSKSYVFKADTTLEIGVELDPGLRLDKVRFLLPPVVEGKLVRTGGLAEADVSISNTSEVSRKVGIAVAVFDDQNRLLGVASGGVRLFAVKAGRAVTYALLFENVYSELPSATKFTITVEPKP